jgi:hypothetical protein
LSANACNSSGQNALLEDESSSLHSFDVVWFAVHRTMRSRAAQKNSIRYIKPTKRGLYWARNQKQTFQVFREKEESQ